MVHRLEPTIAANHCWRYQFGKSCFGSLVCTSLQLQEILRQHKNWAADCHNSDGPEISASLRSQENVLCSRNAIARQPGFTFTLKKTKKYFDAKWSVLERPSAAAERPFADHASQKLAHVYMWVQEVFAHHLSKQQHSIHQRQAISHASP